MIDTNKYEGHTPAPWEEGEYTPSDEMIERFQNRELQGAVMQQGSNLMLAMIGLDGNGEKDRLLMTDAPLLLEEVKRLEFAAGNLSSIIFDTELREQKLWEEKEELKTVLSQYEADPETTGGMLEDLRAEVKRLRVYEVAWKMLYHNAIEEGRETRTRTWKEIMELVRSDVKEMVDTEDAVFDEWAKQIIGGFE